MMIPVLFFIGWVCTLQTQKTEGEIVRLAIQGYDPRSLLSGRYILYQINWDKTHPDEIRRLSLYTNINVQKDCIVFSDEDENCWWNDDWEEKVGYKQRFYIPEENANQLDRLFSKNNHLFEVLYACQKGRKPIPVELLIDGKPWRDFLKENH